MHRTILHRTAGGRGDPAHRGPPSARWPARGPAVAQHGRRRALPFDRFLHLVLVVWNFFGVLSVPSKDRPSRKTPVRRQSGRVPRPEAGHPPRCARRQLSERRSPYL